MLPPPHRLPAEQEADGPPSLTPAQDPEGAAEMGQGANSDLLDHNH